MSDDETPRPKSYVDRLRERHAGLFGPEVEADQTRAIETDRFDDRTWERIKDASKPIQHEIYESSKYHDYVEDLYGDVFNATVKADPHQVPMAQMKPSHKPNKAMVDALAESKEMERLRMYTVGDKYSAAMGLLSMAPAINEQLERMAEAKALAEAAQEARDAMQQAFDEAMAAAEAADGDPSDEEAAAAAQYGYESLEGMSKAEQEAASQAEQAQQEIANSNAMPNAASKAADEREDEAAVGAGFGMDPGELQRMSFDERYELAQKLQGNRLAAFAKMIGQFRQMAAAEARKKVQHAPEENTKIKLGDDLARLVPQEYLALADDVTEDDFYLRYIEHRLLVWEMSGTEKVGRGPIIAVVDESGSMGATDMAGGTTREAWSKALALSLCDQAMREGRDFIYIGFASGGWGGSNAEVWALEFPGGKAPIDRVIDMTEHFFNGGTAFEPPLTLACKYINEYADRSLDKTPDVVFITDDDYTSNLDAEFLHTWVSTKDRTAMRCFGVLMHVRATESSAVYKVADHVTLLSDLANNPLDVAPLFRMI